MTLETLSDSADVKEVVKNIFIKIVVNLISDYNNEKYRQINAHSKSLTKYNGTLSQDVISLLFKICGFALDKSGNKWTFLANRVKLEEALEMLTSFVKNEKLDYDHKKDSNLAFHDTKPNISTDVKSNQPLEKEQYTKHTNVEEEHDDEIKHNVKTEIEEPQREIVDDHTCEQIKRMLLSYDHIRNSLFDARQFMVWRMTDGRSYLCRERCDCCNLEAHWHLQSGKGLLYSFIAHVSKDGKELLHTGAEHGYQYNSIPGSAHFGKIIHFSEKLIDKSGKLLYVKNNNNAV